MPIFSPETSDKLTRVGMAFQGKLPEYNIAQAEMQEQQRAQQAEQQKARTLELLNAGDYLMQGDIRGAYGYISQQAQARQSQGLDASKEMEFARRLQSIQTPEQLQEAARELQMMRQRAVRSGLISQPEMPETGYYSIVTGSDGKRYGIPKGSQSQEYVAIHSPEGVSFNTGGQNININTAPQPSGAFFGSAVESATESLNQMRQSASAAQSRLPALRTLRSLDIESGFGTNARTGLARATNFIFGEGAGDVFQSDVPAIEAFRALSQKMVNEELNQAKGPQTEGDAIRAQQTVASIDKAPAANKFLLNYYEGLAMREMERNQFFERYMGTSPDQTDQAGLEAFREAERAWLDYKEKTPLVAVTRPDGTVLSDANTKVPMVYYDFERLFMRNNEDALKGLSMREKRAEAQNAWREANGIN